MTRAGWIRLLLIVGALALLEAACRYGFISRDAVIPPTRMFEGAWRALAADETRADIWLTLQSVVLSLVLSIIVGMAAGLLLHKATRLRRALDPLLASYYAVPTFVLYPLLIVFFGIGPTSLIVLGALFGIVAMIVATVTAIDRVPRVLLKVARVSRLGAVRTALLMKLPAASPHLMTGLRLAVAYSVIGIIAGEFILSTEGIGRRVALAYNNFDNQTMYALLVLILAFAIALNAALGAFEQALHRRWYRS